MESLAPKQRIHVYLDDTRRCPPGFVLAKNAEECILLLKEYEVDILSLDYDLGWGEATGLDVAKFLAAAANKAEVSYPREIYLHSSSAIGRLSMFQVLYPHKPPHGILRNGAMPEETLARAAEGK